MYYRILVCIVLVENATGAKQLRISMIPFQKDTFLIILIPILNQYTVQLTAIFVKLEQKH